MRLCVYMAVFGGYNKPPESIPAVPGVDYFYFTDQNVNLPPPWQGVIVDRPADRGAVEFNRYYKMFPAKFLQDYDLSLYLDGNVTITGDISQFIARAKEYPFTAFRHPKRHNIVQEAGANFRLNRLSLVELPNVAKQISRYYGEGYPDEYLIEANILLRRHDSQALFDAMDLWWREFEIGVKRDQLSLGYCLWRADVEPNIIDALDRRKKGGLFFCRAHPKLNFSWLRSWVPRKFRSITTKQSYWERRLRRLMSGENCYFD